jgi:hypothetical protein
MIHNKLPATYLSDFLNFLSEAQSHYKFCRDEMETQDKLTQDFLHSLELDELKCKERSKLATQLSINRKERRYYKDRIEELEPIIEFFNEPQNKKVLDKLTNILGDIRKAERYHKNRSYIPKVIKEKKENKENEKNNNN